MKELWVEGKNDAIVFSEIFIRYQLDKSMFTVSVKGSLEEIYNSINSDLIKLDYSVVGVVMDADSNSISRWNTVKTKLENIGYILPEMLNQNGTIINGNEELPRLGIWLMPNNDENGMLEDFVQYLIPKNDQLIPHVDQSLNQIEEANLNKYKLVHKSKARIHTWLAWQEKPGTPMGSAINQTYLDTNQELCNRFIDWINQLFNSD